MSEEAERSVDAAHRGLLRGDTSMATALCEGDATAFVAFEQAALQAELWLVEPGGGLRPDSERILSVEPPSTDRALRAAGRLSGAGLRAALLRLDSNAAETFADKLAALVPAIEGLGDTELAVELRVAEYWWRVLSPDNSEAQGGVQALAELSQTARVANLPHVVIEANTQLALYHLGADDVEEATRVARRASRMARTEALPRPEYFANLVLARVRRVAGMPHLAAHILSALRRIAPAPWHPWVDFERALAGSLPTSSSRAAQPADFLSVAVAAALAGRGAEVDAAFGALVRRLQAFAPFARDVTDLWDLIDPHRVVSEEGPVAAFLRGETALPPRGLHGLGDTAADASLGAEAPVRCAAAPALAGRRLLAPGVGLVGPAYVPPTKGGERRHVRTETALAVLVLRHGDVIPEGEFFREVYGFELVPDLHGRTLDVLLHRVRDALGPAGELVREKGALQLALRRPLVVTDPRALLPLEDRILWTLARHGPGSAREAAEHLGVSVRTVQTALRELLESGACSSRRAGRSVAYEVEDTTFTEPTVRRPSVSSPR